MMIGIYGLLFEFYSPGLVGPGVVGGICLLLALYAFHLLPIDYAGLGLLLLGIALMIAEAFIPSFGIIGLGGLAAFVLGALMLFDTDAPGFTVAWEVVGGAALVTVVTGTLIMTMLLRSRRRAVVSGPEQMLGSDGSGACLARRRRRHLGARRALVGHRHRAAARGRARADRPHRRPDAGRRARP